MKRADYLKVIGLFLIFVFSRAQSQQVTGLYTDFGGYWNSTTENISSTQPNNSHLLLGFTYEGVTYSTGINDGTLSSNGVDYNAQSFRALPVRDVPPPGTNTFIGVGDEYGGGPGDVQPVPVTNEMTWLPTSVMGRGGLILVREFITCLSLLKSYTR